MNKQIEEMAKVACTVFDGRCANCPLTRYAPCPPKASAERLYNAGYRKQIEGEWINKDGFLVCSECDATKPIAFATEIKITYYKCDFCNCCGAKMKGGK